MTLEFSVTIPRILYHARTNSVPTSVPYTIKCYLYLTMLAIYIVSYAVLFRTIAWPILSTIPSTNYCCSTVYFTIYSTLHTRCIILYNVWYIYFTMHVILFRTMSGNYAVLCVVPYARYQIRYAIPYHARYTMLATLYHTTHPVPSIMPTGSIFYCTIPGILYRTMPLYPYLTIPGTLYHIIIATIYHTISNPLSRTIPGSLNRPCPLYTPYHGRYTIP